MNALIVTSVTSLLLALPLASAAQSGHAAHHEGTAATQTAMTDGIVRKVDRAAGSVTIAHEALTNLGMPKMTMTFRVKERAWLDSMKEGARIRFVAANVNGALTVVALDQPK